MGDNKGLKDISLTICGLKKTIKGLTEDTTCDDVIETVFDTLAISTIYASCFGIFESSLRTQRLLPGQTKVLKLIRSWRKNSGKYELIMKRVDNIEKDKTDSAESPSASTEHQINFLDNPEHNTEYQDVNNIQSESKCFKENKPKLKRATGCTSIRKCTRANKFDQGEENNFEPLNMTAETGGKMYILKKYMKDVMIYGEMWRNQSSSCLTYRASGDGSDKDNTYVRNYCCRMKNAEPEENIRTPNNRIRNYRNQAELTENIRTPGDGEYANAAFNERLNEAFLCSDPYEMCNTPKKDKSGLNEAFIITGEDQFHDRNMEISDDSPTDSESYESISSKEMLDNSILKSTKRPVYNKPIHANKGFRNCEMIKHILATASSGTPSTSSSEDSLIESFMKTKVHDDKNVRQCL